jgi:hypothetical protein
MPPIVLPPSTDPDALVRAISQASAENVPRVGHDYAVLGSVANP